MPATGPSPGSRRSHPGVMRHVRSRRAADVEVPGHAG